MAGITKRERKEKKQCTFYNNDKLQNKCKREKKKREEQSIFYNDIKQQKQSISHTQKKIQYTTPNFTRETTDRQTDTQMKYKSKEL